MIIFIIVGTFLGIISGGFIGLLIANVYEDAKISHKIIIILISIIIFSCLCTMGLKSDNDSFNNGYCIRCDTKYEAITHKNGQTYYECPNFYYGIWY